MTELPISYLDECFTLDKGKLIWNLRPENHFKDKRTQKRWNGKLAGKTAGYITKRKNMQGYATNLNGITLQVSRICWALYYGEYPPENMHILHVNGDSFDNRKENLKLSDLKYTVNKSGTLRRKGKSNVKL